MAAEKRKKVLVLVGPTASGKTGVSLTLAKALNSEIISADSMQIYKFMKVGTAKITQDEMDGIPHHLVDHVLPDEAFNVAEFKDQALKHIEDIFNCGKLPIVVGGTGLYINGLTLPWTFETKNTDEKIRWRLTAEAEALGKESLYERLKEVDPITAKNVHPNNIKRMIRALEIYEVTGKPKSYFDQLGHLEKLPYDYEIFGLDWPREKLYERINKRVDQMMSEGLLKEIEMLLDRGYTWDLIAMKAIGYKEFKPYIDGEISKEEAVSILKRDTRHFAKRQMTWFRKDKRIHWISMEENRKPEFIAGEIFEIFKSS